jgi:5-oxoprolinase (ATP-hydrolysing)/N-methylhydantoinase A
MRLIDLQRRWSRLIGIVSEAYETVLRTSFSVIVTEALDFGVDLLDRDGALIAHPARSMPGFDHALSNGLRHVLRHVPAESLEPGDVLICNDPWAMAGHLFDIGVFTPVFGRDNDPVAFFAGMANVTDIGGTRVRHRVREIHDEGLFLPPLKLYRAGAVNEDVRRLIESNVRLSDQVLGDVHALVAANAKGAERLVDMMRDEGLDDLAAVSSEIRRRSADAMRAAIAALPDTTVSVEQPCDGVDEPLTLPLDMTIAGDALTLDFRGAPPQLATGGINCTRSITVGIVLANLHSLLCPEVPVNEGLFEAIAVRTSPGSLLDCLPPAAVNLRSRVLWNLPPSVHRAFEPVLGDDAQAPTGYPCSIKSYGRFADGTAFSDHLFQGGGQGASGRGDGLNTLIFPTSAGNVSIEIFEQRSPILVECKAFEADSGGAGRHRGGLGQRVRVRKLPGHEGTAAMIAIWPEGISFVNAGFRGGRSGGPTRVEVRHADGRLNVAGREGSAVDLVDDQTTVTLVMPGGAGHGNPLRRAKSAIEEDIEDGYISNRAARSEYGYRHDE